MISDDRFVMTLALVMYGLRPIADFDKLTEAETIRVRVLRAMVIFFLETPRRDPKKAMSAYIKRSKPTFTTHSGTFTLTSGTYVSLIEVMQNDSNNIYVQYRALFGLFDHFLGLEGGENALLRLTRTQVAPQPASEEGEEEEEEPTDEQERPLQPAPDPESSSPPNENGNEWDGMFGGATDGGQEGDIVSDEDPGW